MSVSKKTWKKCCRLSLIFALLALVGIIWIIFCSTPEFSEQKRIWMEKAIREVQAVDTIELYTKPAFLSASELSEEIKKVLFEEKKVEHDSLRGIYITAETAASKNFPTIIDALIASGGNAVVMDIELSGGQLAFIPESAYLTSINPGSTKLDKLKSLIKELHRKDIYVIARQVVFNDPYAGTRKPEWRIKYKGGGLFDARWLDPSNPEVQNYNLIITREVARLGFDEIQYDYIRFPDGYHYYEDYHYDETTMERWEVINNFLKEAKKVTDEFGIKLGVDVFGATIYGKVDWDLVGQYIPEIAKTVDVIYPMTYPSHISPGYNGFKNPYGDPYTFIYDAISKFRTAADGNAEIRTWVQGFPLRIPNFGPWFVEEQVRGTYDAGANDFIIWSPGNNYGNSWSSLNMLPPEPVTEPVNL
ncbi:putative glycoside hydrolase [Patescibacteria group bacterium]|nr:putative glycoside hydrolase [Patescibacteria group bacterium]MBU1016459.1 putative glycoside hydrolase [Patescibacteria group bacterium]MBU1684957.1 putative glycoside hydrolase [Patescibacteria group bacterium]MBU1939015.1 putative glycoside hydrolase [Patescibacteria group bacterium]